jgi:diaminopimelate epimerase
VTRILHVAKYQASGNDFLLVDEVDAPVGDIDAIALCDRWEGVGADGVIRVRRGTDPGRFAFDLTNADGSQARISGNGMRCFAMYLRDRGRVQGDVVEAETPAGPRRATFVGGGVDVQMGTPSFTKAAIPMLGPAWETFLDQPWDLGAGLTVAASAVSMGNPHLVLFVPEDPEHYHVEHIGPALEHDARFPERTNVEFAWVRSPTEIDVRVWERGVGETLACGTGACAVAVAANESGRSDPRVTVRFRGGPLRVHRASNGEITLGGPVAHVFDATVDLDALGGGA